MHVIAQIALCWIAVSILFAAPIVVAGFRRKEVRKVDHVGPFGQQPRGDLSELGGLSQSNHGRLIASISEQHHA